MLVYHAVSSNVDVSPSAALERLGKYGMKHFVKHTVAQHWVSICQKGLANLHAATLDLTKSPRLSQQLTLLQHRFRYSIRYADAYACRHRKAVPY